MKKTNKQTRCSEDEYLVFGFFFNIYTCIYNNSLQYLNRVLNISNRPHIQIYILSAKTLIEREKEIQSFDKLLIGSFKETKTIYCVVLVKW